MKKITLSNTIPETVANERLDIALTKLFPDYSRSQLQQWIKNGCVKINGVVALKQRIAVQTNQTIFIEAELTEQTELKPEFIPLDIIYEDDSLIVINKPIGLIVHPGAGNPDHTLVNALLHYLPGLSMISRAGIIHRLDKDTSGLLVIAKSLSVHNALIKQMQAREIKREYRAIVHGVMISGGTVNEPIGRHPTQRTKMAVVKRGGKEAVTHYRVLERFREHSLLSVQLETGRTHQIRVHLSHIHYPIVGDQTYCTRRIHSAQLPKDIQIALKALTHQALHAHKLSLVHPITKVVHEWKAPIPADMQNLIKILHDDAAAHNDFDDELV